MRRTCSIAAIALLLTTVGCGSADSSTPVACLEGSGTYLAALKKAPGEVKLDGETPISGCLVENQAAGDLADVGTATLAVATKLNAEAREAPGGKANLELGYLLGAVERGAESTEGIHAELVRRLTAAARYSLDNRPLPATFLETYREGFDAGNARG
jgi:hypothetical protein